jgi:hypothetical protein
MAITSIYPPLAINPSGLALEATLSDILTASQSTNTKLDSISEELSKNVLFNFFEDPNTLTGAYATIWTVAGKALEAITIKQNDGNIISIAVNGVEKIVAPPSGEVQHFPLMAGIGSTIDIKAVGDVSNAGPLSIEFLG